MYICFFISQPQQHKPEHKNSIKAEKKGSSKNDIRCTVGHANNTLYRCNKVIIISMLTAP